MKKKVAVFPAGTEIGLEINRALKYSTHIELYGFNSVKDHSEFVYKNYVKGIPFYYNNEFIEELNKFIKINEIDFIYPAHDDVQLFLTENHNKINATILTTDIETVRICRSKLKTYELLKNEDFIPRVYENRKKVDKFPIFIKPDVGQGSNGAKIINNEEDFNYWVKDNSDMIICEYLPGKEYTIDCFTDFNGELKVCKMRSRNRIKTGISVNSEIILIENKILEIANIINGKLKFDGAWFFQLKKDINNEYKLLEVAPRVSGTMGLTRNIGINYPLLTIFNKCKVPIKVIDNKYSIEVDRAFISRFNIDLDYDTVYVDLDDTLIINNKVNKFLMMFIYQAINDGKKIIIISKHVFDIYKTLNRYKISVDLFWDIISLKKGDKKSDYISCTKAIFIDDSFAERYEVSKKIGIPVFDTSEVEGLIDWRE